MPPLCPDIPQGPRSDGGSTVPYLGCDVETGQEHFGAAVTGDVVKSLGTALDQVLAYWFPGADLPSVMVTMSDGDMVVDLPGRVATFQLFGADGMALDRALMFTAYSNGAVSTVRFHIDGDCHRYALMVGGDTCSTVKLPIVLR